MSDKRPRNKREVEGVREGVNIIILKFKVASGKI